jgi:hypothetical protein
MNLRRTMIIKITLITGYRTQAEEAMDAMEVLQLKPQGIT